MYETKSNGRRAWGDSMMRPDEIQTALQGGSIVGGIDVLPSRYVRIETTFKYPDGTSIEVFVAPQALISGLRLTDLGQTNAWLLNLQVKPWLSKKRSQFVEDALATYSVTQDGGELTVEVAPTSLFDGVIRLSQACLRYADLLYTRRTSLQSTFLEEILDPDDKHHWNKDGLLKEVERLARDHK